MFKLKNKIIEDCYQHSKKLLVKNSGQYGIMASTPNAKAKKKLYSNIFGRDAGICSLGMIVSQDKKLIEIAKTSLLTLAKYQTDLGEIPSSINPITGQKSFYFLGSIDSNLWWLLALDFYHQHSGDKDLKIKLLPQIKKALLWLRYQDQNNDGLLEEGEACNWSDDMPINGRTLYSNVLWFEVLKRYGFEQQAELAENGINILFLPHSTVNKNSEFIKRDPHHRKLELKILREEVDSVPYYLHYISYKHASDR
ncbi:glycoside hydrolase, partial [Candidatus Parcubacteria bacterium]|nr:glycoside hydrolase [Candidatus Parcubacteria bacterium]